MTKAILKWAGSKIRLMPELLKYLPDGELLIEPFTGSASVFMNTSYKRYVLADSNADLINLYRVAISDTEEFISISKCLFEAWADAESYAAARNYFNQKGNRLASNDLARATYFLYLNRHCFNGLCRYNQNGDFNVPHGKYKNVYFPENEIKLFAEKAKDTKATIVLGDYKKTIKDFACKGAVIYCDPPYIPLSKTSNFTQYNAAPFGIDEHKSLVSALIHAQRQHGVKAVISGSDIEGTRRVYQNFDLHAVSVHRSVSANVAQRGATSEVIGVLPELPAISQAIANPAQTCDLPEGIQYAMQAEGIRYE